MALSSAPSSAGEVKVVPTTCTECSVHCGSLVTVRDGVIENIKPNPAHPLSKGAFCIKGLKGSTGITYSERRLLHPLRRIGERGEGKWQQISWDEALEYAADHYAAVREKHGPFALVGVCNNVFFGRGPRRSAVAAFARLAELDDQSGPLRRLPRGQPALDRPRHHPRRGYRKRALRAGRRPQFLRCRSNRMDRTEEAQEARRPDRRHRPEANSDRRHRRPVAAAKARHGRRHRDCHDQRDDRGGAFTTRIL